MCPNVRKPNSLNIETKQDNDDWVIIFKELVASAVYIFSLLAINIPALMRTPRGAK